MQASNKRVSIPTIRLSSTELRPGCNLQTVTFKTSKRAEIQQTDQEGKVLGHNGATNATNTNSRDEKKRVFLDAGIQSDSLLKWYSANIWRSTKTQTHTRQMTQSRIVWVSKASKTRCSFKMVDVSHSSKRNGVRDKLEPLCDTSLFTRDNDKTHERHVWERGGAFVFVNRVSTRQISINVYQKLIKRARVLSGNRRFRKFSKIRPTERVRAGLIKRGNDIL